jgi:hypothetical protein
LKWEAPQGGPTGILEVTIERKGGVTVIRLINSGFREDAAWNEEYEGVVSGWKMSLAILKHYLENYFAREKTSLLLMRPASFSYEQLHSYFVDSSKLALWLTKSGSIGKVGQACQLEFRDGGTLTGAVLADTEREVTVSWEEIKGTLELKGFSMGPQRVAGVRCITWRSTEEQTQRLKKQLNEAVERLAALLPAHGAEAASPPSVAPLQETK